MSILPDVFSSSKAVLEKCLWGLHFFDLFKDNLFLGFGVLVFTVLYNRYSRRMSTIYNSQIYNSPTSVLTSIVNNYAAISLAKMFWSLLLFYLRKIELSSLRKWILLWWIIDGKKVKLIRKYLILFSSLWIQFQNLNPFHSLMVNLITCLNWALVLFCLYYHFSLKINTKTCPHPMISRPPTC